MPSKNKAVLRAANLRYAAKNREKRRATFKAWYAKSGGAYYAKYRNANRSRVMAHTKKWQTQHPDKMREYRRVGYLRNRIKINEANKKWAANNRGKVRRIFARWVANNPDKTKLWGARYAKANRHKLTAATARRRAARLRAIPPWIEFDKVTAIYKAAKSESKRLGIQMQVDHIVPIFSKLVCGLHCADNLQLLSGLANRRKGNKTWPDMP